MCAASSSIVPSTSICKSHFSIIVEAFERTKVRVLPASPVFV